MKKYIFAHPFLFATAVILGIVTQGIAAGTSLFIMFIIDSIVTGDRANLALAAYISIGVVALFFTSLYAYLRVTILYSYKTVLKIKNDIFAAILGRKISEFSQTNSAKYISLINNDIKIVNDKYISGILAMTKDITTMVFALGTMAFLSPVNAIIALVLSSAPLVVPVIFGNKLSKTNLKHMKKMAALNEKVKDFLLGFEVIKSFGIEKNIASKFFSYANDAEKSRHTAGKVSVSVGSFSGTILIASQIITYLVAGYFVINGMLTIGAVIAIAGLSGSVMQPIQYVSINLANIKSTKEIREGLLSTMPLANARTRDAVADFSAGVQVKNLSFKYDAIATKQPSSKKPLVRMVPLEGRTIKEALASVGMDNDEAQFISHEGELPITDDGELDIAAILAANGMADIDLSQAKVLQLDDTNPPSTTISTGAVLKNISYNFKAGGKYAVVGGSGSGKSTLLKIIMGYYDNYLGQVCVGAAQMRDINRESLYSSLAIMHQNVFLLDDTLRNNITLDNPYPEEKYEAAIKSAMLEDFVHGLPEGSLTMVGEGGNTLSGGERQRVAIARALIKGCEVMIFDEAMASLDNETAYSIEKSLLEKNDLTCIFATHRYTKDLLQLCDGILVLRDGELAETGTFDELYDMKGYFYSLYNIGKR